MASTDAKPIPQKNVAYRLYFSLRDAGNNLITSWTGADSEVSKDGGAYADCTNEATEIGTSGTGYLDLTSTEMNADNVLLKITFTNAGSTPLVFSLFPEEVGDIRVNVTAYGGTAGTFASGRPEVNMTHIAGAAVSSSTAQLGVNLVNIAGAAVSTTNAQLGVNVVNAGGTAWGSGAITAASIASNAITSAKIASGAISSTQIATGAITTAAFAAGAINAAAIAADAIGASELATDAVTEIVSAVWANATRTLSAGTNIVLAKGTGITGFNDLDAAGIRSAVGLASANLDTQLTTIDDFLDTEIAAIKAKTDTIPTFPTNFASLGINASGHITRVVLVDTTTTNSDMISAAGIRSAVGLASANLDTQLTTIDDYLDTEIAAIKAVTDKLDTAMVLDGAVYQFTANALELAPSGGGGSTDWTADERTAIRSILGIPGSGTTPADPTTGILDTIRDLVVVVDGIVDDILVDTGTTLQAELDGIQADTEDIQARLPAALVGGRMDSSVGAMATNVLTAAALATDAVTEIQSGLALAADLATVAGYLDTEIAAILADTNELQTDWVNGGRLDLLIDAIKAKTDTIPTFPTNFAALGINASGHVSRVTLVDTTTTNTDMLTAAGIRSAVGLASANLDSQLDALPTAAENADAVWDESTVGHATASTYGLLLADGAADALEALGLTQTLYDDWINGGRLDLLLDAIKAKTDNLPADPADASDIASSFSTVNTKLDTIDDLIDTEVAAIKAVTDKLDTAMELDSTVYRFTINALEQAPSGGGGGSTDWTADERTAIRTILGIPGSGTTPATPTDGVLFNLATSIDGIIASLGDIPSARPEKGVAFDLPIVLRDSDGDIVTSWTGADSEISKDGGAFVDCTNEATEIGTTGMGQLTLTSTEANCNYAFVKVSFSNSDTKPLVYLITTTGFKSPTSGVAYTIPIVLRDGNGDLVTSWTGADSEISKDGGSFADCTNEATEIGSTGCGTLTLTTSEMTATEVIVRITFSNANTKPLVFAFNPVATATLEDILTNLEVSGGLDAAGVRSAIGLASANLDTQLGAIDTVVDGIATQLGIAGNGLTAIPWNSAWDAEVQSECTDALNAYDPPTNTEMFAAFTEIKGATWSSSTDTLEAIRDRGDAAWVTGSGGGSSQVVVGSTKTITRNINETIPVQFTWGSASATITGTVELGTASAVACQGAVSFISTDAAGLHWYQLAYDADDRPTVAGLARYVFTDGTSYLTVPVQFTEVAADGGATVTLPSSSTQQSRVEGTQITAFINENLYISQSVYDSNLDPVDLSVYTLKFVIATKNETHVMTIIDSSINVTGADNNTYSLTLPDTFTDTLGSYQYSLRDASSDVVLAHGPLLVRYAATE